VEFDDTSSPDDIFKYSFLAKRVFLYAYRIPVTIRTGSREQMRDVYVGTPHDTTDGIYTPNYGVSEHITCIYDLTLT